MTFLRVFRSTLLFLSLLVCTQVNAQESRFKPIIKAVKAGKYQDAIKELKQIQGSKRVQAVRDYWLGVAHARTEKFEDAIKYFRKAIKNKVKEKDVYYEYGQALYANSELERSRRSFVESVVKNYKITSSLYYAGHISQVLEQYKKAKEYYDRIVKDKKSDPRLMQVAEFQLAETILALGERDIKNKKKLKNVVKKKVLPLYERALKRNLKSGVAKDIAKKSQQVKSKYGLDPNKMVNGKRIPKKKYRIAVTQAISYDNNITLVTDLPTQQASSKDSYLFKTTAFGQYTHYLKQKYKTGTSLNYSRTIYSDRDNSDVFTNDGWDVTLASNNTYEHFFKGKPASFLLDVDYTYTARDREGKHDNIFFSRAFSIGFGETLQILPWGASTVKFTRRISRSFSAASDNDTNSFTFLQMFPRKNGHFALLLVSMSQNRLPSAPNDDTDSIGFTGIYIVPEIIPFFILNLTMGVTFTDTKAQSATRGTEKTYTPSIKLTRKSGKHLQTSIVYGYTKNSSLDKDTRDYDKQTYGFEFRLLY